MRDIPIAIHALPYIRILLLSMLLFQITEAVAQSRVEGSAIVRVDDGEYTVPIECEDASRPELGFSTEPNRITRERTGRSSMINIRLRPFGEEGESVVSLDRYVAWMPQPASSSGTLSLTLDMSPMSITKEDGSPGLLTRDMWMEGERPPGLTGVHLEARCSSRDPEAPSYKKIPD